MTTDTQPAPQVCVKCGHSRLYSGIDGICSAGVEGGYCRCVCVFPPAPHRCNGNPAPHHGTQNKCTICGEYRHGWFDPATGLEMLVPPAPEPDRLHATRAAEGFNKWQRELAAPEQKPCPHCDGKGKVFFLPTLTVSCKYCAGTGLAPAPAVAPQSDEQKWLDSLDPEMRTRQIFGEPESIESDEPPARPSVQEQEK